MPCKFSKAQYDTLSDVIRTIRQTEPSAERIAEVQANAGETGYGQGISAIEHLLTAILIADNPAFDRKRFAADCAAGCTREPKW